MADPYIDQINNILKEKGLTVGKGSATNAKLQEAAEYIRELLAKNLSAYYDSYSNGGLWSRNKNYL